VAGAILLAGKLGAQEQAQQQPQSKPEQQAPVRPKRNTGGPCFYKAFKGAIKIISIEKTENSRRQAQMVNGPGYEGNEVKFIFVPSEDFNVKDVQWAQGAEKAILSTQYPLMLSNSFYPSDKFLEKYKIKIDAMFACEMSLITSGQCSPITFQFGGINIQDYIEI
jgi:hypothetical protein